MQKAWQTVDVDASGVKLDGQAEDLHMLAARMLARRGLKSAKDIEEFLNPSWENGVHDPFLFRHMGEATGRIFQALERGEHIVIHGDYDADGVTGSTVLAETLKYLATVFGRKAVSDEGQTDASMAEGSSAARFFPVLGRRQDGMDIDIYIPHREREGYGLNEESTELIIQRGARLVITVDCGIANVAEIARLRQAGVDVIVVDHHQFGEELPDGILIHPKLPDEAYPFKDLAAVGVAWKLASALLQQARGEGLPIQAGWEKWLLDLVAIATVTDIVPLVGENRILEKFGLIVLNKQRRPGIKALIETASWRKGELDSETIGFVLGPRINAAGRMEHAYLAVDLLLERSSEEALRKAQLLEEVNRSRQKATETMMQQARDKIERHDDQALIIAWSEDWSPSLVGLAAGKFTDTWGKPAVFVGKYEGIWIGSGRSIPTYDITAAVREAGKDLLTRHGGHTQACGFSLEGDENMALFAAALRAHAAGNLALEELRPFLEVEAELSLDDLDWSLIRTLKLFEPFGHKNPKPVFVTRRLVVMQSSLVGATQNHLRCILRGTSGRTQKFMGFYRADLAGMMSPGASVDVLYEVSSSEWNGNSEIQCKLIDARPTIDN